MDKALTIALGVLVGLGLVAALWIISWPFRVLDEIRDAVNRIDDSEFCLDDEEIERIVKALKESKGDSK